MKTARLAATLGVLLLTAGAPDAQQPPVFRAGVDLVSVDVTVLDRSGEPIAGLVPEDFVLEVDGRPRPVVSAQFVNLTMERAARAPEAEHYSSNARVDSGRLILVAVDQRHIRRVDGSQALRAAGNFVEALHPDDRVAVTSLTYEGGIEFNRNHQAARVELARLTGQQDLLGSVQFRIGLSEAIEITEGGRRKLEEVVQRECGSPIAELMVDVGRAAEDAGTGRFRDACPEQLEQEARAIAHHLRLETAMSLRALSSLVRNLGSLEGPKTLVLLSEGLAADARYFDMSDLAAEAQAARVTIYALKLDVPIFEASDARESPSRFQDLRLRTDGLARVAGAGRGAMFQIVGSDPRPFQRLSREVSAYYLLAFEPDPGERDGRARRIKVSLASGRAIIRNRPTFTLAVDLPAASPTPGDSLARLLHTPRLATDLPVSVATHIYKEPGTPLLRVVVSAETDGAGVRNQDALLGFVLKDEQNLIAASGVHQSASGRHAFSTFVPPGEYTLKVAALDALRRGGSVERRFVAALPRIEALEVSDLILAAVPARDDIPVEPMVDRAPPDRLLAYLELYDTGSSGPLADTAVQLEIARTEEDAALVSSPAVIRRTGQGLLVARGVLPLTALEPGRYVARADILVAGRPVTRILRAFRVDPDRPRASR